ncbi:MAG: hypothetical protein AAF702_50205 [Chloroflexota bacterium]
MVATSTGRSSSESYEFVDQLDATQMSGGRPHYKLGVLTVDGLEIYLDLGLGEGDSPSIFLPLISQ